MELSAYQTQTRRKKLTGAYSDKSPLVAALLLFVLIFSAPRMFCFLLCLGYILSGLIYTFLLLPRRNRQILRHLTQS